MVAMGAGVVLVGSDIVRIYLELDYRIVWEGADGGGLRCILRSVGARSKHVRHAGWTELG
jgi:hypothetical protein